MTHLSLIERIGKAFPGSPVYPIDQELVELIRPYFALRELVPSEATILGEDAWGLLDPRALRMLYHVRDAWGRPLWVNRGGTDYAGWRPQDCKTGAKKSAHKLGQAFDLHTDHWQDREDLYQFVQQIVGVREVEHIDSTPSWVHISARPWSAAGLRIISP